MTRKQRGGLAGGKTLPVSKGEVGKVAAKLVDNFPRCENVHSRTPQPDYIANCTAVAVGGKKVRVCAVPETPGWQTKGDLAIGGGYSPSAREVVVKVEAHACADHQRWKRAVRSVLRHELAHAADPYVHVRRTPYAKPGTGKDGCAYYRDPAEVTANLAQTEEELLSRKARAAISREVYRGLLKPGQLADVLHESRTYVQQAPCMTPPIKRRFQQLAARLWASGAFGPPPKDDDK